MVAFTDRVAVPAHVMVRVLDNEAVFLNLATERYIGLDQIGTRMWRVLTAAPAIGTAFDQLLDEYDVAPELLRSNLDEFLGRLVDNGLLEIVSADAETPATI
jgi:coenzyme PQQ synthesis protein D (PqqD)